MDWIAYELRLACRTLLREKVFTGAAILTLALGIGGITAVFSILNSAVLQPLPFEGENTLIAITHRGVPYSVSFPYYQALRERSRVLASIGLYAAREADFETGESRELVNRASVTATVFHALKTEPVRGRVFGVEEDRPGVPSLAVISTAFWRNKLGGQEDVLGKEITINGIPHTVIGILPPSFKFPSDKVEVWTPFLAEYSHLLKEPRARVFQIVGSLRDLVTIKQAKEEIRSLVRQLDSEHPELPPSSEPEVLHYRDYVIGGYRQAFFIMLWAGVFMMTMACINVTNLFLMRSEKRRREIAVRVVLGASKIRMLSQQISEALIVAAVGSVLGGILAWWSLSYLSSMARTAIPRLRDAAIGLQGIGFAIAVALAAAVVVGLLSTTRSRESGLHEDLAVTPMISRQSRSRMRGSLVMVQFACALILVIGAGLLLRSLHNLLTIELGFNPYNVLTFYPRLPPSLYRDSNARLDFCRRLEQRLESLPGVNVVGRTTMLPFGEALGRLQAIRTDKDPKSGRQVAAIRSYVSPGYFKAMGMSVLKGRTFSDSDRQAKDQSVILDENLAREFWPNEEAVGKRLFVDFRMSGRIESLERIELTVIGVVSNVTKHSVKKILGHGGRSAGQFYRLTDLYEGMFFNVAGFFVLRTHVSPLAIAEALQHEVAALDKAVSAREVTTMETRWLDFSAETRFYMVVLNIFGLTALVLAAVGIYGVTAFAVAQRTHELGVRMALGAEPIHIFRLVAGEGLGWVLCGVAMGCFGGLALSQSLKSMLFEVSGTDAVTLVVSAVVLSVVGFFACYPAVRRATRLDPWVVLRAE